MGDAGVGLAVDRMRTHHQPTSDVIKVSFFLMVGGQLYTYAQIQQWLTTAGFGKVRRPRIVKAGSPLMIAERV